MVGEASQANMGEMHPRQEELRVKALKGRDSLMGNRRQFSRLQLSKERRTWLETADMAIGGGLE